MPRGAPSHARAGRRPEGEKEISESSENRDPPGGSEPGTAAAADSVSRSQALQALNDLAIRLLRLDTTVAVYEAALDGVLEIVGAGQGAVALVDDAQHEFRLLTHRGYSIAAQRYTDHLGYDTPAAHNLVRTTGDLVIIHPDRAEAVGQAVLRVEAVQTAVLLPLFRGTRVIAVLSYLLTNYQECPATDREVLRTAATFVGAALDRAALYEAVAAERARLAVLVSTIDIPLTMMDAAGRITVVNTAWETFSGHRRADVLGHHYGDFASPPFASSADNLIGQVLATGEPIYIQEFFYQDDLHPEGIFMDGSVLPVREIDGRISGAISVNLDVTARVRMRQEVEAQRVLLETIFEATPIGISFFDREMRLVNFNAEYARMVPIDPEMARGQIFYDLVPSARERQALHARVFAGEAAEMKNVVYQYPDGTTHYCDIHYRPVRDAAGAVTGMLCASIDVTARYELDRQKDEFIALASHELKTPLTAIKAYAQIGRRLAVAASEERMSRMLGIIDAQSDRLTRLIGELLDVSLLESVPLALYPERVDLARLVAEVVDNLALTNPEFTLATTLPGGPVLVTVDRQRIEQVLVNLVQNAIKYSGGGRRVEITLQVAGAEVVTAVRDFGVGIPAGQQAQVFERFFRASNVSARHYSGLGLGLFISHSIVTRHGGRMWLQSTEGAGSTFYFALPPAPVHEVP